MASHDLHKHHERTFESNRFVYPVLSRRSRGISIGVNLNPDKVCNFDCVYCQVDRTTQSETRFVELDALLLELRSVLELAASGRLYQTEKFRTTPPELRRINDIAFSGDGEPTTYKNFDELMLRCAEVKRDMGLDDVKMVLITNASMFHREHVKRGLGVLDNNNGEIWAKLDTGTEAYYKEIIRSTIPFTRILDNIRDVAKERPIVIQTLFMKVDGVGPDEAELAAYLQRLTDIIAAGGHISLVQIYTIARRTTEENVTMIENEEVDRIVALVRDQTGLNAAGFYGSR